MSKWTEGPWELFNKNGVISIYKNNKEVIKWTGFDSSDYPENVLPNARLIALAPTLADKLKATVEWLDREIKPNRRHVDEQSPYGALLWRIEELRDDLAATLEKLEG